MASRIFTREAERYIESLYKSMKDDPQAKSFYLSFLFNLAMPYFKLHKIACPQESLLDYLKVFVSKKEASGELIVGHTVNCLSCHKKVFGPFRGKNLPKTLCCPYCGTMIDTENDYVMLDHRYFFADKSPEFESVPKT